MAASIDKDLKTRVWNALTSDLVLAGSDQAEADQMADRVISLINLGEDAERHERRKSFRKKVLPWVLAVVLLGGLGSGIFSAVWYYDKVHANDYAGIDPQSVPQKANRGLHAWYGLNDFPADLTFRSQTHSEVSGVPAWKSLYKRQDGKLVCVYTWIESAGQNSIDRNRVSEGQACLR